MVVQTDDVTIRPATTADAEAIARVHVSSWQGAYSGVLPSQYVDSLDTAGRAQQWATTLAGRDATTLVAEADGRTLGFASFGPARDEDAEPGDLELYAIYLDPEAWGLGVARDLMRTVLAEIPPGVALTLWVPAENARAQHFYRRHGFQPDGVERLEETVTEVRYRRR